MSQRVPYDQLTTAEREAIWQWLNDHGVNYRHVPADTDFAYDDQTGEWTVDVFKTDAEGRHYLNGNREIARDTVTFIGKRDLPWRRLDVNAWRCPHLPCTVTTSTAAEMVEHFDREHATARGDSGGQA